MTDTLDLDQFAWLDDKPPVQPWKRKRRPHADMVNTLTRLRERPGDWARLSCHTTSGAAWVKVSRWRSRLEEFKFDGYEVEARELYPHTKTPWALVMRYAG